MPALFQLIFRALAWTGVGYFANDAVEIAQSNARAKAEGDESPMENPVTGGFNRLMTRFKTPGFLVIFLIVVLAGVILSIIGLTKTQRKRILKF